MIKRIYLNDKQNPANIIYPITDEQSVRDSNGVTLATKLSDLPQVKEGAALGRTAYQKPVAGIPASDIAAGVIPDVSSFITKSVNDLVYYYTKSETYTKEEVAALIGAIQQFHYEIAASTADVSNPANNVLYLIGPTGSGADKYEEYVYDSTKDNPWIKIGDTSIDLSNYVTTSALNTALANYTTTANLTTLLSGKQDTLVSGTNIKTVNGESLLGSGNITAGDPNAVKYIEQTLTSAQQAQARTNIGATAPEIFWAIYGTTTASEIQTAIDSGKLVLVKTYDSDDEVGMLSYYGSTYYFFIVPYYNGLIRYQLSNNVWSKAYVEFQKTSDLVTSWNTTPSDSKYPSEKLVKDGLNEKYVKPTSGIPSSDLAPAVQTSLGKADTALQSFTETDPTVPSWAKAQNPPTEIFWATYGTTTATEIQAALDANKLVFTVIPGNIVVAYQRQDTNYMYFGCIYGANSTYIILTKSTGGWINGTWGLEIAENKVSSIVGNESNTTKYPNCKAVADAIAALPEPMVFRGTIGTNGDTTTVPSSPAEGDTYKIISGGESLTFTGITDTIKVGDTVIYKNSTAGWSLIPSGDEPSGTVTAVTAGAGLNTTSNDTGTDGGTISSSGTIHLTKSGVTAGSYQGLTVDKYGRVTAASNQNYGTYSKPSGGIPASDLASGVIPTVPVQDVTVGGSSVLSGTTAVIPAIPDAVSANPTVPSGTTPTALTGLKIGSNYYDIEAGGGTVTDVTVGGTSVVNASGVAVVPAIPTVEALTTSEIDTIIAAVV